MKRAPLTPAQHALLAEPSVVPALVRALARRSHTLSADELTSIGRESEIRAAQNFDPSRGVPFPAYAFQCVRLDLLRALGRETNYHRREHAEANAYLARLEDPGDLWADQQEDHERHLKELADGMLAAVAARFHAAASRAPTENDLVDHLDRQRASTQLRESLDSLGDRARVVYLRHMDDLPWDEVAARLGCSSATARREHDAVTKILGARLSRGVSAEGGR